MKRFTVPFIFIVCDIKSLFPHATIWIIERKNVINIQHLKKSKRNTEHEFTKTVLLPKTKAVFIKNVSACSLHRER